jgi:predicted RecB family nuclease
VTTSEILRPVGLSKSRVMAGRQCHKLLWWMVHEPAAPELQWDGLESAVMDQGTRVGELARTYVPGGVLIDLPYNAFAERLAATEQALLQGSPAIYEAAFRADNVFVSVDILERRGSGHCLVEVKSTTGVKEHHLADVAIQTDVLRRSGLDMRRMEVMHLNRGCTYPDLTNLFIRADITQAVEALLAGIPRDIAAQTAMLAGALPSIAVGDHCSVPYECPFVERCWPELPPHHVSTLYAMRRRALELDQEGYHTIHDLPEDVALGAIADRQRRAVQAGQLIVEPGLAQALEAFVPPIAFLDFETVGLAVPVWSGCHPYDAVPVQFSCHVAQGDDQATHHEWLAEGPGDPRPALAEHLVAICRGARTVVAYNAPFERRCLEQLAATVPQLAGPLNAIAARLIDLLPVVRNYVYHPDFGGSFSLKSVVPALISELQYDELAIGDGQTASLELVRLLFDGAGLERDTKARLRANLQRYCSQDTWGLVRLLERLHGLAPVRPPRGRVAADRRQGEISDDASHG